MFLGRLRVDDLLFKNLCGYDVLFNSLAVHYPRIRDFDLRSVCLCRCGRGEHELLLIGSGDFLVEGAQVLVFLGLDQCECARELAGDGDLARGGDGLDGERGVASPWDLGVLRHGLKGEAGWEMIDDLVGDLIGVVHVDRLESFVLIDQMMSAASFKKKPGKRRRFGGSSAEITLNLDDGNEVYIGIVDSEEVIEVGLNALGTNFFEPVIKLLFELVGIAFEVDLPPPQSCLAAEDK